MIDKPALVSQFQSTGILRESAFFRRQCEQCTVHMIIRDSWSRVDCQTDSSSTQLSSLPLATMDFVTHYTYTHTTEDSKQVSISRTAVRITKYKIRFLPLLLLLNAIESIEIYSLWIQMVMFRVWIEFPSNCIAYVNATVLHTHRQSRPATVREVVQTVMILTVGCRNTVRTDSSHNTAATAT